MSSIMLRSGSSKNQTAYYRKVIVSNGENKKIALSALGVYRAYLNGEPLSEEVFLPGRTSYDVRLQVQEYDLKLKPGKNVLCVQVNQGWYKNQTALYCDLKDGWKCSNEGPLLFADMKIGEVYDAAKETNWLDISFDDSTWENPKEMVYEGDLIPHEGERITEHEFFLPEVLHTPDGGIVLDFKQNIAGYVEFKVEGKKGQIVKMVYGETLDENGNFTQKNLMFKKNKQTGNTDQTIEYRLKDGCQIYKPQASVHGFQYVKPEDWPTEIKAEDFRAIAVYSDLKQVGSFECSNPLVNQLVSNIRWSTKGNFLDIPTDCPQRERAGWTGDIMVYSIPATYQMDTLKFLRKWLKDVVAEQGKDGRIKNIVPDGGMPPFMDGAAGWSDAIIKLPWVLYQFYGDKTILSENYEAMKKHVDFMIERSHKRKIWNAGKGNHWNDLIDTGFHWGEWLEPGSSMPAGALKGFTVPDVEVASAYYAWSAQKLSEIALVLDHSEDAEYYKRISEKVKKAYRKEFLKNGRVESNRQCRYVRPVALDLVDENTKKQIVSDLNEMVKENRYHIGTGFLSTPHICNVLSDFGYTESAYRLLENEEQPGWLYEVKQKATTMWENWYGKDDQGHVKNSLNHYSPGAIISWLYSRCAGIQPLEPGFEKICIAPAVGGSFQYVKCSYQSKAGLIRSNWRREGSAFTLELETPRITEVHLPDGTVKNVEAGSYRFECDLEIAD